MSETLLQKAIKTQKKSYQKIDVSEEDIEAALAWCDGKVRAAAIAKAKGMPAGSYVYQFLARALKEHIRRTRSQNA